MATYEKAKPLIGNMLNYEVVGGTTAPTAFNKENTIWIDTSIPITEYTVSYEDLYSQTIVRNYEEGLAQQKMNSAGVLASDVAWYMTVYYPVFKNAQYYLTFTETGACSGYYDKNYNFISSFNVTGNAWTSLPSIPNNAVYVRFCIRVYSDADDRTKFQYRYTESHTNTGDVWIQTDIDNSPVSFNAIKKNELMIYPYKLKQWDGSKWKSLNGTLYQSGTAKQVFNAGYSIIENFSSYTTYNYDLINPPLTGWGLNRIGANLVYSCGAGRQAVMVSPQFNLSNYSALVMTVSERTLSTSKGIRVGFTISSAFTNTPTNQYVTMYNAGTYRIDLSNVTGNWYLNFYPLEDLSNTGTITFSEFMLEE